MLCKLYTVILLAMKMCLPNTQHGLLWEICKLKVTRNKEVYLEEKHHNKKSELNIHSPWIQGRHKLKRCLKIGACFQRKRGIFFKTEKGGKVFFFAIQNALLKHFICSPSATFILALLFSRDSCPVLPTAKKVLSKNLYSWYTSIFIYLF